jgi:hypothetical protein
MEINISFDGLAEVANNVLNKLSDAVGWIVNHDTPNKIATSTYIQEIQNSNYDPLISDNTLIEISNSEACKVYDIYKILSRDDYELGKSVSDFIVQFKAKYADVEASVLK